jgi:hypothetical protein
MEPQMLKHAMSLARKRLTDFETRALTFDR